MRPRVYHVAPLRHFQEVPGTPGPVIWLTEYGTPDPHYSSIFPGTMTNSDSYTNDWVARILADLDGASPAAQTTELSVRLLRPGAVR